MRGRTWMLRGADGLPYESDTPGALGGNVRYAVSGSAPLGAHLGHFFHSLGIEILEGYGLTESTAPATVNRPGASKIGTVGTPLPGVSVRVMDDGEVEIKGVDIFKEYWNNPEATAAAFDDGWFRTGDLAVRHPDSYVEVKDGSKDIIISGGENISSLEVEEALYRHPAVLEAAVVARSDPKWGESPCAFVTLKPDAGPVDERDVIAWCRDHLAHFKVPRRVVFQPLPKTSTGKIQKTVLRDEARSLE